jgi:hypothetical protein
MPTKDWHILRESLAWGFRSEPFDLVSVLGWQAQALICNLHISARQIGSALGLSLLSSMLDT